MQLQLVLLQDLPIRAAEGSHPKTLQLHVRHRHREARFCRTCGLREASIISEDRVEAALQAQLAALVQRQRHVAEVPHVLHAHAVKSRCSIKQVTVLSREPA